MQFIISVKMMILTYNMFQLWLIHYHKIPNKLREEMNKYFKMQLKEKLLMRADLH